MNYIASKTALVTASIAIALATFGSTNAEARHENDLVGLSHTLEDIASELRGEFRVHFSHTRAYRHLISDAARIEDEAEHVHRLAHDPHESLRHIQKDLEDLDELAHHLHDLVDATDRGHYGHVHGCTKHVHELMQSLTRVIHAMEREVDELSDHGHGSHHGHDDHYGHHRNIQFERGGFRISFRR